MATFLFAVWWLNLITYNTREHSHPINNLQAINLVNKSVFDQRQKIVYLYHLFLEHKPIGYENREWIRKNRYIHLIYFNPYSEQDWNTLIATFQPVPVKAVVQRAVLLSQSGTSALARNANNFFNILISRPEYGWSEEKISKEQRNINWLQPYDIQYAKYFIPQRAVTDYVWLLNTATAFKPFRQYRDKLIRQHKNLNRVDTPEANRLLNIQVPASASQYGDNNLPQLQLFYGYIRVGYASIWTWLI